MVVKTKLIGIVGAIGSGKDSVASHLVSAHGFTRVSFGDAVKNTIVEMFGVDKVFLFGTQVQKNLPLFAMGVIGEGFRIYGEPWASRIGQHWTGRYLCEYIGTEAGRAVNEKVWINKVLREVKKDRAFGIMNRHVIPDVRFLNEAVAIERAGGVLWRTTKIDDRGMSIIPGTGHSSDEEWKEIQYDAEFTASHGHLDALFVLVDKELGL